MSSKKSLFYIIAIVVVGVGAYFLGNAVSKNQAASVFQVNTAGTPAITSNPSGSNPAGIFVWANGACWSIDGNVWSQVATTTSCSGIITNGGNRPAAYWLKSMTTVSIPKNLTDNKGSTLPNSYVWMSGACWSIKGSLKENYNWSLAPSAKTGCPALPATSAR